MVKFQPYPYANFETQPIWQVIDRAIDNLSKNRSLKETTMRRYIVGYICLKIAKRIHYKETSLKSIINKTIADLVENQDLQEKKPREVIVDYIYQQLLKLRNKDSKTKYKDLINDISYIFQTIDPMDLIAGGAPDDEYSSLVSKILPQINKISDEGLFREYLNDSFKAEFGTELEKGKLKKLSKSLYSTKK